MQKLEEYDGELTRLHEATQRLSMELGARSTSGDDLDDIQRTINDLESQLDSRIRSEQMAQVRIRQLEEELKNLKTLYEVCDLLLC